MYLVAFDQTVKRQIQKIVEYAKQNVYSLDDVLDMKNGEVYAPGDLTEHLVVVPIGRWICYYLVDHPEFGRTNYFQIKPDAVGNIAERPFIQYLLDEFGVKSDLQDKHIIVVDSETKIILPVTE